MSAAKQETYNKIKTEGVAKPTTPDETQDTDGIRFCTLLKGHMTRSSIYERQLPDKISQALCFDGPKDADNHLTFASDGSITLMTGKRDPNRGAGSGRLNIKAYGGQQQYKDRVDLQFNEGGDTKPEGDGQALNIVCYGDYVENSVGSERHIRAEKILITATSELVLQGGSIKLQSESDIELAGTAINSAQINKKEIVLGQIMKFGAGEETGIQFDPRSSVNIISPGHVNHKILGDYVVNVGGQEEHLIAGVPRPDSTLVKDKTKAFGVKAAALGIGLDAATFVNTIAGGATTITSGGASTLTAGAAVTIAAGKALTATAGGAITQIAGGAYTVTAVGNVTITGALILLN
jgi:hypothetical protein